LNNLSLRQLRAVEAVARCQSFVEAAGHLHLTPSALTESVKAIETSLGARLFDRTTRRVSPTAVGRVFIELIRDSLNQLDQAVQIVAELQNLERGLVRCVGATSALACLVSPCLSDLQRYAPQIGVEMRTSLGQNALDALRSGDADFCVGVLPSIPNDDLDYLPLICDDYGLVAARHHPVVATSLVDLRQVRDIFYATLTTERMVDHALTQLEDIPVNFLQPSIRVDGTGCLAAILQQGVAVSILSALVMHQIGLPDLKFCHLAQPFPERVLGLSRLRERSLTPAAQTLWNLIVTHAPRLQRLQGVRLAS